MIGICTHPGCGHVARFGFRQRLAGATCPHDGAPFERAAMTITDGAWPVRELQATKPAEDPNLGERAPGEAAFYNEVVICWTDEFVLVWRGHPDYREALRRILHARLRDARETRLYVPGDRTGYRESLLRQALTIRRVRREAPEVRRAPGVNGPRTTRRAR